MFDEEYLAKKLFEYRSVNKLFKSNSFPTISAFGKNGQSYITDILRERVKR